MNKKDLLILLVPSVVSIISIFISNYLGVISSNFKNQISIQEKTYNEYHIPLIQWLLQHNKDSWNYARLIAMPNIMQKEPDFILSHISKNISYAPSKAVELYSDYFDLFMSDNYYSFSSASFDNPKVEKEVILKSDIFDQIIIESLKEASILSNKLGYPDIARPVLDNFSLNVHASKGNRHIPWTGNKNM